VQAPRRRTRSNLRTNGPGQKNLAPSDSAQVGSDEAVVDDSGSPRAQIDAGESDLAKRRDEIEPKPPINKEKQKKLDDTEQGGFEEEELW
jgi:hypothetical protein